MRKAQWRSFPLKFGGSPVVRLGQSVPHTDGRGEHRLKSGKIISVSVRSNHGTNMKAKFTYVGIRVKDLEKSIDFYTKVLGMKLKGRGKNEQTKGKTAGLESEDGGFSLELNYYEKNSPYYSEYVVGEGLDHLAFGVDDLDKALEEAKASGYRVLGDFRVEGGRWAYIEDPNGIWIELF